jgi:hypothetical protein
MMEIKSRLISTLLRGSRSNVQAMPNQAKKKARKEGKPKRRQAYYYY